MERVEAVWYAMRRCRYFVPDEIMRATGQELHAMLAGILPGLLMALGVMAVTTLGGATAGAAIGALAAGVGAAPGAAAGAALGAEAGAAILEYLGLAFLVAYVGESLARAAKDARTAVGIAWRSVDGQQILKTAEIDRAARGLATAVADVFRGVLQGLVAFLLSKGPGVAKARLPELVGKLRASKLGEGFATWVERNWEDLIKNPKLRPAESKTWDGGGGTSANAGHASTPSRSMPRRLAEKGSKADAPNRTEPRPPPRLAGVTADERALAASTENSPAAQDARRKVVSSYLREYGREYNTRTKQFERPTDDQIDAQLQGHDLTKPARVGPPPPCPTEQIQWQRPEGNQGSYYTDPGIPPDKVGISALADTSTGAIVPKVSRAYEVQGDAPYLESTAAPTIDAWSIKGAQVPTSGGEVQRVIGDRSLAAPAGEEN